MKNPCLLDQHIYLRALEREDAGTLLPWVNDPEVTRSLLIHRPMSLAAEEAFIDKVTNDPDTVALGIVLRESDRLVGACGLHKIDYRTRQSSFGIFIGAKEEWGKGYGTEATRLVVGYAFDTLNLNRVWLHVFEYNRRGIRAYEKAGFRREGVLRQDSYREGRYWDTVAMGVLREEWQK